MDEILSSSNINSRLKLYKKGDTQIVVDENPPIFILPFVMNTAGTNIQYVYLHEYTNLFGERKQTVIDISPVNFDTNIDVVYSFVSRYFSIPAKSIDVNRVFYLGECDVDVSMFKSCIECYGVNITGLIKDNEVRLPLSDTDYMIRAQYYDVMKGHYMDVMTMGVMFQLMSNFMH